MTYTIKITKEEYDFIIAAVDAYASNLRHKMANQATSFLIGKPDALTILEAAKETRAAKKAEKPKKRRGRTWTPEERKKQSELVRQRWAARRGAAA